MYDPNEPEYECGYCPEDDNLWPASAFTASGNAYNPDRNTLFKRKRRMCNGCWSERYKRTRRTCVQCGKEWQSWVRIGNPSYKPFCKACTQAIDNGAEPAYNYTYKETR